MRSTMCWIWSSVASGLVTMIMIGGKGAYRLPAERERATIFPNGENAVKWRQPRESWGGTLTPGVEFVPIALVKHVLPALVAVVFALSACKTTADRFDLFAPNKAQGPATERLRGMTLAGRYDHRSSISTYPMPSSAPQPAEEGGPIAPPPPPPPGTTPDNNVGAPGPTPMPEAVPAPPSLGTGTQPVTPGSNSTTPTQPPAIPGLSAPVTTAPAATPGSSEVPPPPPPAAPAGATSPAPVIPGLSQ
jgi:hypothetical protein